MEAKDKIKSIVDFVMDLDMLTGIDTDEQEHIETAVIEGYKAGIKEVVEWHLEPCSHFHISYKPKGSCEECWRAKFKEWELRK